MGISGEAYSYLQAVVTRLSGGRVNANDCGRFEMGVQVCAMEPSIDDFMQRNLLRPFGMASSGYFWTPSMEANIAWGHDPKGQPLKASRKPNGPAVARYAMAGGLSTTPTDYAKFLSEILAPRPSDAFRRGVGPAQVWLHCHDEKRGNRVLRGYREADYRQHAVSRDWRETQQLAVTTPTRVL